MNVAGEFKGVYLGHADHQSRGPKKTLDLYEMQPLHVLMLSILVLYLGFYLNRKIQFLSEFYIPPAVTGGLICSIIVAVIYGVADLEITFDMQIRDLLLLVFFSTIGLTQSSEPWWRAPHGCHAQSQSRRVSVASSVPVSSKSASTKSVATISRVASSALNRSISTRIFGSGQAIMVAAMGLKRNDLAFSV